MILQELPKLPNGKRGTWSVLSHYKTAEICGVPKFRSNLKQLAEMATDHVVEEGEADQPL